MPKNIGICRGNMVDSCNHLEELMNEHRIIIERHVDKHKYYKHIVDKNQAVIDFLDKYRFIIREAFCDLCPESKTCEAYREYLKKDPEISEDYKQPADLVKKSSGGSK